MSKDITDELIIREETSGYSFEKSKGDMQEDIKVLEEIIKGDEDCIENISKFNSNNKEYDEDIEHYKREIRSITNIINSYKKEKARADKLEKEYSKMLTKIDEYEVNYIPVSLVEEKIEEYKNKIDKLYNQKVWNEPMDTIYKNRYVNYINILQELLEKR